MHFSPKIKRNLIRILPFGLIWLVTGFVFLLTAAIVTGNQNLSPDSSVFPRIIVTYLKQFNVHIIH